MNPLPLADAVATARKGAVVTERPDLAALWLTGKDVLGYLHRISSQHVAELEPGSTAQALLLSPKGRIEFEFWLAVLEGGVLLGTEREAAEALAERLRRFVFRFDVAVHPPAAGGVAASLIGPAAGAALQAAGLPAPPGDPGLVVRPTPAGLDLVETPAGRGRAAAALAALAAAGAARGPEALWEVTRVALGLPRWGRELTEDVLAEEAGLLGSHVHLSKGCYPGQETVARVHNLGQVRRRLVGLELEGAAVPPPRTELLTEDGRPAGEVRSAVAHPELGVIALAYARREVAAGQVVLAAGQRARVAELPFTGR